MALTSITVRHNVEVAHRLYLLPGRCENIHGHSMWVSLTIQGVVNSSGILSGMDFGSVKKEFRTYLDNTYDHHLLLNEDDPWALPLSNLTRTSEPGLWAKEKLPGLVTFSSDPTTENLARWVGEWAERTFSDSLTGRFEVTVQETSVNAATWRS